MGPGGEGWEAFLEEASVGAQFGWQRRRELDDQAAQAEGKRGRVNLEGQRACGLKEPWVLQQRREQGVGEREGDEGRGRGWNQAGLLRVCLRVYMHVYVCAHMCMCVRVCACVRVVRARVYACMCMCACV